MDDSLSITFSKAEAIVLYDLLFDFKNQPQLVVRNGGERVVLWMLKASLEKDLVEPFLADYTNVLEESRQTVLARWGSPPNSESA